MTALDPQWALLAAALVFIITPGIALFYGGRERATSMVNMMMLSAGAIAVTTIVWTLWGWSIAFAGKDMAGGIIGDPFSGLLLRDSMVADHGVFTSIDANSGLAGGIPSAFRLACAVVAVSLITGALAGRVRYAIWLIFVAVWCTLVFAPVAHMVLGSGLFSANGAIAQALGVPVHDFAGGTTLHIVAAVSSLAIVTIIGGHAQLPLKHVMLRMKAAETTSRAHQDNATASQGKLARALWDEVRSQNGKQTMAAPVTAQVVDADKEIHRAPHNVPFVMLGIFIIWFGWLGLMIGSSVGLPGVAGYAWMSSTITASASMLAWGIAERLQSGRFTALGAASGVMAGLAASSAVADVIAPLWAIILGAVVGVVTCFVSHSRFFAHYDGALHVVSVNGVAATIGVLAVGLFSEGNGLFVSGDWRQLLAQVCLLVVVTLYAGVVTAIVAFALEKLFGWRISVAKERKGVDLADQGERAYDFSAIAQAHSDAVVEVNRDAQAHVAVLTAVTASVQDAASAAESLESVEQHSTVVEEPIVHAEPVFAAESKVEANDAQSKLQSEEPAESSQDEQDNEGIVDERSAMQEESEEENSVDVALQTEQTQDSRQQSKNQKRKQRKNKTRNE